MLCHLFPQVRFIQERVDALTNEELMSPVGLQRLSSLQHSKVNQPPCPTPQPSPLHQQQRGPGSFPEGKVLRSATNHGEVV